MHNIIDEIKRDALDNNVPIIEDEGLAKILEILKDHQVNSLLEIGAAVGYSSLMFNINTGAKITTIERNDKMYEKATFNLSKADKHDEITLIHADALEFDNEDLGFFDVIYIDGAKAQYEKFLRKYEINLADDGIIIFDNLNFHGYVDKKLEEIESKNLRQLIRKIKNFNKYLEEIEDYDVTYYEQGDGIGVLKRKINE